jgi:beta-lactamase regulating signal transducer with metallopeptidase domain
VYGIPAAVFSLLLTLAILRLQLLRRRAEVLVEPQWSTALAAAQRRMGFKHGTALLVSEELRSPISWGVVRPIILLDARAAEDAAQAEAIIAHELAHVARLDWAMLILGRLATSIFWFNPLVWLLARRCHELSEQAVDDTVLRSNIRDTDYADC